MWRNSSESDRTPSYVTWLQKTWSKRSPLGLSPLDGTELPKQYVRGHGLGLGRLVWGLLRVARMQVLMWKDSTAYPTAVTKSKGKSVYVCKYWCMCVRVQAHVCVHVCMCVLMGGGWGAQPWSACCVVVGDIQTTAHKPGFQSGNGPRNWSQGWCSRQCISWGLNIIRDNFGGLLHRPTWNSCICALLPLGIFLSIHRITTLHEMMLTETIVGILHCRSGGRRDARDPRLGTQRTHRICGNVWHWLSSTPIQANPLSLSSFLIICRPRCATDPILRLFHDYFTHHDLDKSGLIERSQLNSIDAQNTVTWFDTGTGCSTILSVLSFDVATVSSRYKSIFRIYVLVLLI